MRVKKFTKKDRHGNMMSFEFDVDSELGLQQVPPMGMGVPRYKAVGGMESNHPGEPKGKDTVPAWLTPVEFVVNKEATDMYGPIIKKMNDHGRAIQNGQKPPAQYANKGKEIQGKYQDNVRRIYTHLKNKWKLNNNQIGAILGQIGHETGGTFDYQMLEKNVDASVQGQGLLQNTPGKNRMLEPYLKYLNKNELTNSPESQIDFFMDSFMTKGAVPREDNPNTKENEASPWYHGSKKADRMRNALTNKDLRVNVGWKDKDPSLVGELTRFINVPGEALKSRDAWTTAGLTWANKHGMKVIPGLPKDGEDGNLYEAGATTSFPGEEKYDQAVPMKKPVPTWADRAGQIKDKFMDNLRWNEGGSIPPAYLEHGGWHWGDPSTWAWDKWNHDPSKDINSTIPDYVDAMKVSPGNEWTDEPYDSVTPKGNVNNNTIDSNMVDSIPENAVDNNPLPSEWEGYAKEYNSNLYDSIPENAVDNNNTIDSNMIDSIPENAVPGLNAPPKNNNLPEGYLDFKNHPILGKHWFDGLQVSAKDGSPIYTPNSGKVSSMAGKIWKKRLLDVDIKGPLTEQEKENYNNYLKEKERFKKQEDAYNAWYKWKSGEETKKNVTEENNNITKQIKSLDQNINDAENGNLNVAGDIVEAWKKKKENLQEKKKDNLATIDQDTWGQTVGQQYKKPVGSTTGSTTGANKDAALNLFKETKNEKSADGSKETENKIIEEGQNKGQKDPGALEKAEGVLKDFLGPLFDTQELKRMAVLYLGSRLLGFNHGGSLQYAAKGYLKRVDTKEAAINKFIAENSHKFTAGSIQNFKRTGDYSKLIRIGQTPRQVGERKPYWKKVGNKMVKGWAREYELTDPVTKEKIKYTSTDGGKTRIDASYQTDPKLVAGTPEYQDRRMKMAKHVEDRIKEDHNQLDKDETGSKTAGNYKVSYKTNIKPAKAADEIVKWAMENNIDPLAASQYGTQAYNMAIAHTNRDPDGIKPSSLRPFLEQLAIVHKAAVPGLLKETVDGETVTFSHDKFKTLNDNIIQSKYGVGHGLSPVAQQKQLEIFYGNVKVEFEKQVKNRTLDKRYRNPIPGYTPFALFAQDLLNYNMKLKAEGKGA